jgi:redox-sensitive bicupin YhaK (pirin superfamily)
MMTPRYQNIFSNHIPLINREDGVKIRVIAGEVDDIRGPVTEIVADPTYLDVTIPPGGSFSHPVKQGHAAFVYVFEGGGSFGVNSEESTKQSTISQPRLVVFADGDYISASTTDQPVRFLLISGQPLNEPIACQYNRSAGSLFADFRPAPERTHRQVRTVCHEHPGRNRTGIRRYQKWNICKELI